MEIYHQLGYNDVWNRQSLIDDRTGNGFIIAPRHMPKNKVKDIEVTWKRHAIFDPQFFVPSTALGELTTYDFFPGTSLPAFATDEFCGRHAKRCASGCVKFQVGNGFRYIVIPTRYCSGTPSDFIEQQKELTVQPFLEAVDSQRTDIPIALQLVLNSHMLTDVQFRNDLLNWVTGTRAISAVYLITQVEPRRKQLNDPSFLLALMQFTHALRMNSLDVILGYLNCESLVLSVADPSIVTMGSYEKTRMFNISDFRVPEKEQGGGPNPRLYVSRLLQWIDHRYLGAIEQVSSETGVVFDSNHYQARMFEPTFKWHFTKPELYKHYFLEMHKQLRLIGQTTGKERYECVAHMIAAAMDGFSKLDDAGVALMFENGGGHLPAWLTAANMFAKERGWRS